MTCAVITITSDLSSRRCLFNHDPWYVNCALITVAPLWMIAWSFSLMFKFKLAPEIRLLSRNIAFYTFLEYFRDYWRHFPWYTCHVAVWFHFPKVCDDWLNIFMCLQLLYSFHWIELWKHKMQDMFLLDYALDQVRWHLQTLVTSFQVCICPSFPDLITMDWYLQMSRVSADCQQIVWIICG